MLYYFIKSLIIWFVSTIASIIALSVKHKITRVIYSYIFRKTCFVLHCFLLDSSNVCYVTVLVVLQLLKVLDSLI